ncbi:MAG: shikimate dehydrogenase [Betaproteobacteria bacterium]|nr:shikimate dehydrogenase [Betaproteobacteria bacterium]
MSPDLPLDGETRLIAVIGDPIAQVKSPGNVTRMLHAKGHNVAVVPTHVSAADFDAFIRGASCIKNLDGLIVTVPHKFSIVRHCTTISDRARLLGVCNTIRRNADGTWHGDMLDGLGFIAGINGAGCQPTGKRAMQVGAGGAGTAIAAALLEAGVAMLAIHDLDPNRRDSLIAMLRTQHRHKVQIGSPDPTGFNLVVNASPAGMKATDPYPVMVDKLTPAMFVADVITAPEVTPLLATARRLSCGTQTGIGMFNGVADRMVAFLLEAGPLAQAR